MSAPRLYAWAWAIAVGGGGAVQAADANDRFKGGSYDGWGRDAMSEYAALIFRGTIFRFSKTAILISGLGGC